MSPVEDGAYSGAVGAVAVDMKPGRQEDPIFDGYRAMWEWRNEKLVPACSQDAEGGRGLGMMVFGGVGRAGWECEAQKEQEKKGRI